MVLQRPRGATTRAELELERDQIVALLREWDARVEAATARGARDLLIPPAGCCGVYVALFLLGSLILSIAGFQDSTRLRNGVAAVAIFAGLAAAVTIGWRREVRRRTTLREIESGRVVERAECEGRLREIEADLQRLG
jgi:hypothetical protein